MTEVNKRLLTTKNPIKNLLYSTTLLYSVFTLHFQPFRWMEEWASALTALYEMTTAKAFERSLISSATNPNPSGSLRKLSHSAYSWVDVRVVETPKSKGT